MRAIAAAMLMVSLSASVAAAQTAGSTALAKPVKTTTIRPDGSVAPARPAMQTPAETANSQAATERMALQSDLAWVGAYNGAINGEVSDRLIIAIKSYQKDNGSKPTGILNPQQRNVLTASAKAVQDSAGWKIGIDPLNGIKLGLPTRLAPIESTGATGTKWASAQGQIQIETWRTKDTGLTIAAMAEREKKEPSNRKVEYSAIKPDFFVLSGTQGLKKFYVRGQLKGSEVRGMTILYDQATEGSMGPVVIAMSSAFAPFSGDTSAQTLAPPPRKKVEYATALVVSANGVVITDRNAIEACDIIGLPGYGPAERIADDPARGIALLRVYGVSGLKPVLFADVATKSDVTVTGIADPQNQGGGDAISSIASHLTSMGGDVKLTPAPGPGLSGAVVTDRDGHFAGLAILKPVVMAGPGAAPAQATLVSAEIVRQFVDAAGIPVATGSFDPKASEIKASEIKASEIKASDLKASVLRVICVRK